MMAVYAAAADKTSRKFPGAAVPGYGTVWLIVTKTYDASSRLDGRAAFRDAEL